MTEPFYIKRGRRYVLWGNLADWNHDNDAMPVGTFRLIHCPEPGHYRTRHDVTPDTAAFLAAAMIAHHAMEEAMFAAAKATPRAPKPKTSRQRELTEQFRNDMAAEGALLPTYWQHGTAWEIAQAGIEAVRNAHEERSSD